MQKTDDQHHCNGKESKTYWFKRHQFLELHVILIDSYAVMLSFLHLLVGFIQHIYKLIYILGLVLPWQQIDICELNPLQESYIELLFIPQILNAKGVLSTNCGIWVQSFCQICAHFVLIQDRSILENLWKLEIGSTICYDFEMVWSWLAYVISLVPMNSVKHHLE